jgi:uncharacterized protein
MSELKLSQIWIYPIKSLGGIQLTSSTVMGKGLRYDRRWMLVDPDGRFLTQRVHPSMAQFRLSISSSTLTIQYKEHRTILSLEHPTSSTPLRVQIWDDVVEAFEVTPEHSKWFTAHLGIECKLVYFPEDNARRVDPDRNVNDEHVSLADAYPFLIIGQRSLDDLNNRLSQPLSMKRFRPNLVFTGGEPYDEDTWRNFTIGSTGFMGVKPCARCVLTTIDPETSERGDEPLRTLSKYRKQGNNIYFGQNVVALDMTEIHVGDIITLKNHKLSPPGA